MFNKQGDHQKRPIISKHFFPEAPQKSMALSNSLKGKKSHSHFFMMLGITSIFKVIYIAVDLVLFSVRFQRYSN